MLDGARRSITVSMEARKEVFSAKSAGSAFHVYAPRGFGAGPESRTRAYAVAPGKLVTDTWAVEGFRGGVYHLCVCGPNGFLRELVGTVDDPPVEIHCGYVRGLQGELTGDVAIELLNQHPTKRYEIQLLDHMYGGADRTDAVARGESHSIRLPLTKSSCWYDFTVKIAGAEVFARRCAGRVETGAVGHSDPVMGRLMR
jgi:phospholipase C